MEREDRMGLWQGGEGHSPYFHFLEFLWQGVRTIIAQLVKY